MDDPSAALGVRESRVAAGGESLYVRELGAGRPVIVVHGGPDFDSGYLAPEMDRLAERFHIVYYDQRGRGRSFTGQRCDGVTMSSEVVDLECVRSSVASGAVTLIGHSWGVVLVLEYALRQPEHVARLVLMNPAPASHDDAMTFRAELGRLRSPEQTARMRELRSDPRFAAGDRELEGEYYRIHYRPTLPDDELLTEVVGRFRIESTPEGIRAARAIEDALYEDTWLRPQYDLLPALGGVQIPTLLIHGEHDLVPTDVARRIADALPQARFELIAGCGHFAFVEQPERITTMITGFLDG